MAEPWIDLLDDVEFLAALRQRLGLPDAPIVAALADLTDAQRRSERQLLELAEAMTRAEEQIANLAERQGDVRREVGGLSEDVGLMLEESVLAHGAAYLRATHAIAVGALEPGWLPGPDGSEEQIDAIGEGQGPAGDIVVIIEVKGRVRQREVQRFRRKVERVTPRLGRPVLALLVGHALHPDARAPAREAGIALASVRQVRETAS